MLLERYQRVANEDSPRGVRVRDRLSGRELSVLGLSPQRAAEADLRERLERLVQLRHPALVRVHDFGHCEHDTPELELSAGQPYLLHAPTPGLPLGSEDPALTGEELLAVTVQLLSALDVLHGRGGCAGDLASAQVFLQVEAGLPPRARLLAVGPSSGPGSAAPQVAPERREGRRADVRSDLFGLGTLLRRALERSAPDAPEAGGARRRAPQTGARALLEPVLARLCAGARSRRSANARAALDELVLWSPEAAEALPGELPEAPLVARDAELERLLEALRARLLGPAALARRHTPWVQVRGEIGLGRSRLLEEVARRLRLEGVVAVELSGPAGADPEEVLRLARRAPVLALARDLDWAAPDAREAALELARRLAREGSRAALAVSLEPAVAREPRLGPTDALAPPLIVELQPLRPPELTRLLSATLGLRRVPDALREWVARCVGGGNPGLVRLALAHLVAVGVIEPRGSRARLHLARLDGVSAPEVGSLPGLPLRLKRDSRRALQALAMAATPMPRIRLAALTGLPEELLDAALEPLLHAGLVVARAEGGSQALAFRRDLTRAQVFQGLRTRERQALGRAHLVALRTEAGDTPPADLPDALLHELARQALALVDRAGVQRFLAASARRSLAGGSPRRAAERLSLALRPAFKLSAAQRVELLELLGAAQRASGEPAAAGESYARALATRSPKVGALARVRLHRLRAGAVSAAGEVGKAAESLGRARDGLARIRRRDGAWEQESRALIAEEAQLALQGGRFREVLNITGPAIRALPRHGDAAQRRALAGLWNLRGLARFHLGELERARRLLARSLKLCRELELPAGIASSLGNLGLVAWSAGELERARRLHRRSGSVARAAGVVAAEERAHQNLANIAAAQGRLRHARRHYRRSLALAARLGRHASTSLGLSSLGDTFLGEDDPSRARPYFERAAAIAQAIDDRYALALARVNQAHADLLRGEWIAARRLAGEAVELRRTLGDPARLARALALAAWIEVRLGRGELAETLLEEATTSAARTTQPAARGELELARAEALLEAEQAEQALGAARAANEALAAAQHRRSQAQARLLVARAQLAGGDLALAAASAERARAEANAAGARGLAVEAGLVVGDALLAAGGLGADRVERLLDGARQARSRARALCLPELERNASGACARLLAYVGRADEARAERAEAKRCWEAVLARLPRRAARSVRSRPSVVHDLGKAPRRSRRRASSPPAEAPAPPAPRPAVGSPAAPGPAKSGPEERAGQVLQALLTLFQAERAALLRREGAAWLEVEGRDARGPAQGSLGPLLAFVAAGRERAACGTGNALAVPVAGGRGMLACSRRAPFAASDLPVAAGFAAALASFLRPAAGRSVAASSLRGGAARARYGLVGRSPEMLALVEQIERFAPFRLPVLVQGESGTGKELVARALHDASPRHERAFVALNAGALAEGLVSVELFGAERGAYTGAEDRPGLFELADGGTLFLDEVADMPLSVQVSLLRVLEVQRVRRVGGAEARPVDVRVVCASNQDLQVLVRSGQFREDLFYRLSGLALTLPPLRARGEDVVLLARHFLQRARREGRSARLGRAALRALREHSWPGNVRELRNAAERAVALAPADEPITPADLGLSGAELARTPSQRPLATVERDAIVEALARHRTIAAAARALAIDRRTLRRRMDRYGVAR